MCFRWEHSAEAPSGSVSVSGLESRTSPGTPPPWPSKAVSQGWAPAPSQAGGLTRSASQSDSSQEPIQLLPWTFPGVTLLTPHLSASWRTQPVTAQTSKFPRLCLPFPQSLNHFSWLQNEGDFISLSPASLAKLYSPFSSVLCANYSI